MESAGSVATETGSPKGEFMGMNESTAAAVRERVARTGEIEAISDVHRKAYRRQLHRLVRCISSAAGLTETR